MKTQDVSLQKSSKMGLWCLVLNAVLLTTVKGQFFYSIPTPFVQYSEVPQFSGFGYKTSYDDGASASVYFVSGASILHDTFQRHGVHVGRSLGPEIAANDIFGNVETEFQKFFNNFQNGVVYNYYQESNEKNKNNNFPTGDRGNDKIKSTTPAPVQVVDDTIVTNSKDFEDVTQYSRTLEDTTNSQKTSTAETAVSSTLSTSNTTTESDNITTEENPETTTSN